MCYFTAQKVEAHNNKLAYFYTLKCHQKEIFFVFQRKSFLAFEPPKYLFAYLT